MLLFPTLILCASLDAATIEDLDEMNPLEYAILSDAGLNTVKLLQKAAAKTLTARSRSNSPVNNGGGALPVCVCVTCRSGTVRLSHQWTIESSGSVRSAPTSLLL